jgi:toxin YoeB
VKLVFEQKAWEHLLHWQETDRATLRKINGLIKECLRHPYDGTGKPEPLRGDLSGAWSRRIDREHRLVYRVKEDAVEIIACRYHC